jgi:hypothetical protein
MRSLALLVLLTLAPLPAHAWKRRIKKNPPDIVVSLERGSCPAGCPVYRVYVFADNTARFEGDEHVAVKGQQDYKLEDENALMKLRSAFAKANFDALSSDFIEHDQPGQPTVTLTYKRPGRGKRVAHNLGDAHAPPELAKLEALVDEVAGTARYVQGAAR